MSLPPLPKGMMWRHYEDAGGRKIAQQVPIPDYIPYDEPEKRATLAELQDQSVKAYAELWRVLHVKKDNKNLNTSETSLGHEFVACLTRLDQRMQRIESLMSQLLEAMAEDDEDEQPRTYMDGTPI